MKQPAVYILASNRNGTLYIGVTSNLQQRIWQHKECKQPGFTDRFGVKDLVWFECTESMEAAIAREKQLKKMATQVEDQVDRRNEPILA